MTIHTSDPFATPDGQRSPVRRLRGRLPAPVTLWTAGSGSARSGLTVSSVLVVDGDPGRVIGVVDEESDLWTTMSATGRFAVTLLHHGDHLVADRFAGLLPAPGGLFREGQWQETPFGPVSAEARTWAGASIDASRSIGWGLLVEATLEHVHLADDTASPLVHVRARYRDLTA